MMGEEQKNVDTCRKKMSRRIPMWTRICLVIFILGNSVSAQTTFRYDEFTDETSNVELVVTEDTNYQSSSEGFLEDDSLISSSEKIPEDLTLQSSSEKEDAALSSSSEKTNNDIPEIQVIPQDILKKHVSKKIEPPTKEKPGSKSHRQVDYKIQLTTPGSTINNNIHESKRSTLPDFVQLNSTLLKSDAETEIDATTETEIETQDETEFDFSTINYSNSDSPSESPISFSTITTNNTTIKNGNNLSSTSNGNSNPSSSTSAYQVRKISTLKKDFYSEESTVPVDTVSLDNQFSSPQIENTQNSSKSSTSLENSTVSYKILTEKFEDPPPMLTTVASATPVSTLPVLPETKVIIEDTTKNPSKELRFNVSDILSTKRELKTTTPEPEIATTIKEDEEEPTTIATVTAPAMSTAILTSKMLTMAGSTKTTTNVSINASTEPPITKPIVPTGTTKTMIITPMGTTKTTMNMKMETTQSKMSTPMGTDRIASITQMGTTTPTTSTTSEVTKSVTETSIETEKPTTVPTTVMILTPIASVTAATINKITTQSTKTTPSVITISYTQSSDITRPTEKVTESMPVTTAIPPKLTTDDIMSLVQIIIKGTWDDICPKIPSLKKSLADLINNDLNSTVSDGRIRIYKSQCSFITTPTSLMLKNPLTSVLVYVVNENNSFNDTLTKIIPKLYEKSPFEFTPEIQSLELGKETDSEGGSLVVIIVVAAVTFIFIVLLAALIFLMKKRQSRFNYGERCRPVSLDAYSLDSVSAYNSIRRSKAVLRASKRSYGNPSFEDSSAMPTHPLTFARLTTFCNESNAIVEEFGTIPQVSSKIDELPVGAELKNRYANVIPLPETRVYLQAINNDPMTEYINASYVRGPKNSEKFYIASQAPTENTVNDFWRMIWEQQCKVIIMLTDLVENGVEKCTEYVPPLEVSDCHRLYGDYQVTLKKREAKDKYAISTLLLKNLEKNIYREVWHIWYLWPTKGVPNDPAGLVSVLQQARALQRGSTAPILVHCSPGTGRTGTVIAIDLCIRQFEITRTVDVPRIVYTIRRDRAGAVQTREQYGFIYKTLNYYADKLTGGAIEST